MSTLNDTTQQAAQETLDAHSALAPESWLAASAGGDLSRWQPLQEPCLLLDLRNDRTSIDAPGVQRLSELPCPVIGVVDEGSPSPLAALADCLARPGAGLDAILRNVYRHPIAAMTLVQLSRAIAELPVPQALDMESLAYATLQSGPEYRSWLTRHQRRKPSSGSRDSGPAVLLERRDDTLAIRLNRPSRHNPVSVEMRDALTEALELAVLDQAIRHIDISANGKCFSIGGDLEEFGQVPDPATGHLVRSLQLPGRWLARCARRCTVHVHGACIGAGVELPAFAAKVVAHPNSHFQLPELGFGLIPGAGGCVSIPRRIGRQRFLWLALSGRRIRAPEALDWGLVDALDEHRIEDGNHWRHHEAH